MKLFPKLMLTVLVLAMLLPFTILKDESGNTWMSFSDLKLPDFSLPSLPNAPRADSITESADFIDGRDTIYQWHDSEGTIQFTTDPPPEGTEYRVRQFDPDTNVIKPVEMPVTETPAGNTGTEAEENLEPADPDAIPYSPAGMEKLMENARNIEQLLNQRFQRQESEINQ